MRVRAQADRVDLVLPFVLDPRLDQVGGEDASLKQVVVVDLEPVEDGVLRRGHLVDRRRRLAGVGASIAPHYVSVLSTMIRNGASE